MVLNNLFIGQQQRNRHREQTFGHGEMGREGEMYGRSNIETYITICKIDSQKEFAVRLRKLKQDLCINLEDWDGEGDGREVQKGGDICISAAAAMDHAEAQPRGATPHPTSGVATESARMRWRRSGQEELPHVRGQGPQPRQATPVGAVVAAQAPEGREELLHIQGQEGRQ